MDFEQVVRLAKDSVSVRRVFGEPLEADGAVVLPAAEVIAFGGGGQGHDEKGGDGGGGGLGLRARPVGAYVVQGGQVTWRPAWDVNKALTVAAVLTLVFVLRRPGAARRQVRQRH